MQEMNLKSGLVFCLAGICLAAFTGCHSRSRLPEKNSKEYAEAVSDFYVGLAALEVGHDVYAEQKLSALTKVAPAEPAGWANWGILALRQRNYNAAAQRLDKARELASNNDQIYDLLGVLESQRGNSAAAIADLQKAVELNPENLRAIYQLAEETARQGADTSEAQFDEIVNVHFKGVYFLTQKLLPLIRDGGRIVNISSGLARFALPGSSAYGATKGAVEVLTRYLAKELGPRCITANVVAPGAIQTDFSGGMVRDNPEINKRVAEMTALGRAGVPDDIGPMIAALLSDENRWVNGQRIEVSGGMAL